MFKTIMVPVDLRHAPASGKALSIAADFARNGNGTVVCVGVTSPGPGPLGHTPAEFEDRLRRFAAEQGAALGLELGAHAVVSADPATELDRVLQKAIGTLGADLVVMATHVPGFAEYLWASHGGHLAAHSTVSVFLVRG